MRSTSNRIIKTKNYRHLRIHQKLKNCKDLDAQNNHIEKKNFAKCDKHNYNKEQKKSNHDINNKGNTLRGTGI